LRERAKKKKNVTNLREHMKETEQTASIE